MDQGAVALLENRLYWVCTPIGPKPSPETHWFSTDNELVYEGFNDDFGPLNLSMLYRYCRLVNDKLASRDLEGKKLVHFTGSDARISTNTAFLAGAYLICYHNFTGEEAWSLFMDIKSQFVPFRDASTYPSTYNLPLLDCFKGLFRAKQDKFFDFASFDPEEYEFYEKVENGDFNMISSKFMAFSSPAAKKAEICPGVWTFTPRDYFKIFRDRKVTAIVRLNKKTYDRKEFMDAGFNHYDLYFLDGSTPPPSIVQRFLEICEMEKGCLAIHCKAGLGRTGTLIGLYVMKHYRWTANEFIAWNRIARPGSVIGPQQAFLREHESKMWLAGDKLRNASSSSSSRALQPASVKAYNSTAQPSLVSRQGSGVRNPRMALSSGVSGLSIA